MTRRITAHLAAACPTLGGVIAAAGAFDLGPQVEQSPYEALGRAIAHQQLNGKAAESILRRLLEGCGGRFPQPARLLALPEPQLRTAGFSFAKIRALRDLAEKSVAGLVPERAALLALDDEAIIRQLTQVRGIGRWTVEMLLLFQLRRPDVMPADDFGVRNGFRLAYGLRDLPAPRTLAAYAERWAPYRSAAAWYLWRAVDLAKAGALPAPARAVRLPPAAKKVKKRARATSSAASAAPPARSDARTRARPRPAPRSRAPAKKK